MAGRERNSDEQICSDAREDLEGQSIFIVESTMAYLPWGRQVGGI